MIAFVLRPTSYVCILRSCDSRWTLALEAAMGDDLCSSKQVDAYIAAQRPHTRRAFEEQCACIRQAAHGVNEMMNYDIPACALVRGGKHDQQLMMAGYPPHVGFYPHPDVIEAFANRLVAYKFAKGSVQFPLNQPNPTALIAEMVKCRLSQLKR